MKSIAFFQFSTEEDLSFVLEFSGLGLSGRDFEIKVTERSSNTTKATLTNGSGITVSGSNVLEAYLAKADMVGWARGEYSADIVDITGGGASRVQAVRFDYNLPGRLVQGVQDRKAYINWSPNQAVVTATGAIGPKGAKGDAATVAVGDVTTGAAGSDASVTNVGTSGAAVFDFEIPRGDQGDTGPSGTIAVGDVTTGAAGSEASVTNVGTSTAAIFDFAIPAGEQGIQGDVGNKGWSPSFAVASDGVRRVLQVDDWAGGEGTKPATGDYVGPTGLTPTIGDAVDIRGPAGTATIVDGDKGDITTADSGDTWTLNDGAVDIDKLAASVYADQPTAEAGTSAAVVMHPLGVKQARDYAGYRSTAAEGAVPGILTSQSTVFQTIFDALPDGASIKIPAGTYYLDSEVSISKEVHVDARGAKFIGTANVTMFNCYTAPSIRALSSNYTLGSTTVSVSALAAALVPGQPVKFVADPVDPANRDSGSNASQYRTGEWATAGSGGSTTSIVLRSPLRFSRGIDPTSTAGDEAMVDAYTTAFNARVLVPSGKTMSWVGGEFAYEDGHDASWNAAAFAVAGYSRPLLSGLKITRGYQAGINLVGTVRAVVRDCDISNLNDNTSLGQYGYGVADAGYQTVVSGCRFANVRHAYTTSELLTTANDSNLIRLLGSGRIVGAQVVDCSGSAGANALFDTHHGAEDVSFQNCIVDGGSDYAFSVRGRGVVVDNCQALNTQYGIFAQTEFSTGDPDDDNWVAGKPSGFTTLKIQNFKARVRQRPFHFSRVRSATIAGFDVQSTSHQLIKNEGSAVVIDGEGSSKVATYDGALPIIEETGVGILDTTAIDASLVSTADWAASVLCARGCDLRVDANAATDASSNLIALRLADSTCTFENRGSIRLALSNKFSTLISGTASSYTASESSLLRWAVASLADNAITLGLRGTKLRAQAVDETALWDGAGIVKASERLVYRDTPATASVGTGGFVTDAYVPTFPAASSINSAGHYARYELDIVKTGTTGVATIRSRIGSAFNFDIPMAATDLYCHLVIEVFTTGSGAQKTRVRANSAPNPGVATPASAYMGSNTETTDLSAISYLMKFDVSAAVGDTVTFDSIRVYSDTQGFGV